MNPGRAASAETTPADGRGGEAGLRPLFRLADLWEAPLHDLPIRDEILFQYLPVGRQMRALEVGPGSGFTALRLSRLVRHLTVVDVGADNVSQLREVLKDAGGVNVLCADVCNPGWASVVDGPFDVAYALEVFELLPDPLTALRNFADVLRPGGCLLLQFPNYAPPRSPGPTHYRTREDLDGQMREAGFSSWEVYGLKLLPHAGFLYGRLHERPLRFLRQIRNGRSGEESVLYDESWSFKNRARLARYRLLIHALWGAMLAAIWLGGRCFERTPLGEEIFNRNLLVLARRSGATTASGVPDVEGMSDSTECQE
jgi:SAM-dependent methyltransferase